MAIFKEQLMDYIESHPGLSDRELANALEGRSASQQHVNAEARRLSADGLVERRRRRDGILGNYPTESKAADTRRENPKPSLITSTDEGLSEDEIKAYLENWRLKAGWRCSIAWGHQRGVDIEAVNGVERWLIEVKGIGSRQPMPVNYFIGILGETLQRMEDPDAKYSIALPDVRQFRGLWERLPSLAKSKTRITALFVTSDGQVAEHN